MTSPRARILPAVGWQARWGRTAQGQRPAVDIEVQGWVAGAQTVNQIYLDTTRLMIQVAPLVFADNVFALKGGTAINLFVRDMPRLSVDLDLVFVDHRLDRGEALARINEVIRNSVDRLKKRGFQTLGSTQSS
jgi:Nucleotidyl transferase AbiEii toxin, Type IV TA system